MIPNSPLLPRSFACTLPLFLILAMILSSCQVAAIVNIISQALVIAEQAAGAAGLLPPEYVQYVTVASQCIGFAATEEATGDTAIVKADKITAQCAKLTSATLPPGTAQNLVTFAANLAVAIQNILANLPGKLAAARPGVNTKAEPPLSSRDISALRKIAMEAELVPEKMQR